MTKIGRASCRERAHADAVKREWNEHCIEKNVRIIAGQEMGTKTEHIKFAAVGIFFQAEDGIRGKLVTGVQTCALPILSALRMWRRRFAFAAMKRASPRPGLLCHRAELHD